MNMLQVQLYVGATDSVVPIAGRPVSATPALQPGAIAVWGVHDDERTPEQWRLFQAAGFNATAVPGGAGFVASVTTVPDYPGAVPVITHVFAERIG